jgi:putative CocE/NonD family hydrolase
VDTDFTAKLIDVYPPSEEYPDGYDMNLSDGIKRARYRNSYEEPEFITPGKIYELSIEMFSTSNLFKKGHRIRVDISSSNYPTFDPNPNTGELLSDGPITQVAQQTVYHDAQRPSCIVLPLVPV